MDVDEVWTLMVTRGTFFDAASLTSGMMEKAKKSPKNTKQK